MGDPSDWGSDDVADWARELGYEEAAVVFADNQIEGELRWMPRHGQDFVLT